MIAIVVSRRTSNTGSLRFASTTRAAAPFQEFDEARVAVGGTCLRVLVASTLAQRVDGLRDVRALGPYDGMLFAFPSDTDAGFTMAQTPLPLDIAWFDGQGRPLDRTTMTPCPQGTDATCPEYRSREKYRYALERRAGAPGSGALGACGA
jgi:uncharacterized membrane protein (UPF0127 family)